LATLQGENPQQIRRIVLRGHGVALLGEDRPRVHLADEAEHRDARLGDAVQQRPLERSGPPVSGEQRGMDVAAAEAGKIEKGRKDELAEVHHEERVRALFLQGLQEALLPGEFLRILRLIAGLPRRLAAKSPEPRNQ